jgi:hypothetical protein
LFVDKWSQVSLKQQILNIFTLIILQYC